MPAGCLGRTKLMSLLNALQHNWSWTRHSNAHWFEVFGCSDPGTGEGARLGCVSPARLQATCIARERLSLTEVQSLGFANAVRSRVIRSAMVLLCGCSKSWQGEEVDIPR